MSANTQLTDREVESLRGYVMYNDDFRAACLADLGNHFALALDELQQARRELRLLREEAARLRAHIAGLEDALKEIAELSSVRLDETR